MKLQKIADKIVYMDTNVTKRLLYAEDKILNFVLNMRPGQVIPPHTHEDSDMVIHILVGDADVTVDGVTHKVTEGDVFYCKGEELFEMTNTGDKDLSAFVVITPNPSAIYSKEF